MFFAFEFARWILYQRKFTTKKQNNGHLFKFLVLLFKFLFIFLYSQFLNFLCMFWFSILVIVFNLSVCWCFSNRLSLGKIGIFFFFFDKKEKLVLRNYFVYYCLCRLWHKINITQIGMIKLIPYFILRINTRHTKRILIYKNR